MGGREPTVRRGQGVQALTFLQLLHQVGVLCELDGTLVYRPDPADATVVADSSAGYRRARLWLKAMLRKSPVPLTDPTLTVAT